MGYDRETILNAANRLEELRADLLDVINRMREDDSQPYALVYGFRREVSRVTATLGAGIPARLKEKPKGWA